MKLYNIYYIETNYPYELNYECTTDNPQEWLEEHNRRRDKDKVRRQGYDNNIIREGTH